MFSQLYFGHSIAVLWEAHFMPTSSCPWTLGFSSGLWQPAWVFKPTLGTHFWLTLAGALLASRSLPFHGKYPRFQPSGPRALMRF